MTGETLIRKRHKLGLSQARLAAQLGVSANTVARWERNELRIEHPEMLELALKQIAAKSFQH